MQNASIRCSYHIPKPRGHLEATAQYLNPTKLGTNLNFEGPHILWFTLATRSVGKLFTMFRSCKCLLGGLMCVLMCVNLMGQGPLIEEP